MVILALAAVLAITAAIIAMAPYLAMVIVGVLIVALIFLFEEEDSKNSDTK